LNRGTLFVVATPIGNRGDLSPRAVEILKSVDVVASEDTRRTGRLLAGAGIEARLKAFHEHNEEGASAGILAALAEGRSVALVSDAGTPLISDPGYRLLARAHAEGIAVSPVPGPSAVVAALSVAGLPTDRFAFEGFLPAKRAARRERLHALAGEPRTLVFYEAVHRVRATVADLCELFGGERPAFVGRELTKLHEQCLKTDLRGVGRQLDDGSLPARGEFVLVVAGASQAPENGFALVDALLVRLAAVMPERQAVDIVAGATGAKRNAVYRRMLALKDEGPDAT